MSNRRQSGGLLRFLALHAVSGAAVGLLFAAGLLVANVANLGTLFASTDRPVTAGILFFASCALTFGSLKMGVAVMTLSDDD